MVCISGKNRRENIISNQNVKICERNLFITVIGDKLDELR